ncbi:hypothetical protein EVAR_97627_1 [Eumeta japonica]|uniref:Uncharacterized protein n=1 Tax=Eumeta variegata TaxID=151549 RepID=A0A4C2AGB8_EUMVA|nr:hypothetical protein EVAR_97627_1 [Eumeta japonica]
MSFSSTLLHARKSRANSEISELLTARRMDITVWMSSPNDVVPAVAEAGSDTGGSRRTASPDGPGAAPVAAWALVYPTGWRRARGGSRGLLAVCCWRQFTQEGFSPDSRVRGHSLVQCGTNISRSAGPHDSWRPRGRTTGSGGTALTFLVRASTRIPERPHTMFRLLNIFLASSVLGRTARTSIMVSRLCGKVCAPSAQEALAAEVGLDFVYREVGRNAADNGL